MKNQAIGAVLGLRRLGVVTCPIACILFGLVALPSLAQLKGITHLAEERELYSTFPENNDKGSILDVTNPMELMNRLRRATAMDNATEPSDAIDQALKALEDQD